ncbi:MAG TPA: hypothetical protein VHH34_25845, partial [Pseudonocardiaceae bacterium]|nr:hypothetical protein [Pseudonocardiaceae bacterium]
VGIWVSSTVGSPEVSTADVLWPAVGLGIVALGAVAAVILQLRWANRATNARAVLLRSLLVLAGPGAVVLTFALAA